MEDGGDESKKLIPTKTIILLLAVSFIVMPIVDAAKNPIKQPTYHRDVASVICPVKLEDTIWIPPMRQGYGGYYKQRTQQKD